jgi:tRNA(Arg) A34 adenosine deaminase TadA
MSNIKINANTFRMITPYEPSFLSEFTIKSRYTSHSAQVDLLLELSGKNLTEAILSNKVVAPFSAVIFDRVGRIVGLGVDSPGITGHEVNNALIAAKKILNGRKKEAPYTLVTLTPPCIDCFNHIKILAPDKVISVVHHQDLTRFFPDIEPSRLAPVDWQMKLNKIGIRATYSKFRSRGIELIEYALKQSNLNSSENLILAS